MLNLRLIRLYRDDSLIFIPNGPKRKLFRSLGLGTEISSNFSVVYILDVTFNF